MKLNYECHITLPLDHAAIGAAVAEELHWTTSEIERDPVLGKASYFYLTTHDDEVERMFNRMRKATTLVMVRGGKVLREKIELIIYDKRFT